MFGDRLHRRGLMKAFAALGGLAATGCDRLSNEPRFRSMLDAANSLTYRAQRLLIGQSFWQRCSVWTAAWAPSIFCAASARISRR